MGEISQDSTGAWERQHASPVHLLSHVARRTFALPKTTSPTPGMFAHSSILYMTGIFDRRNSVEEAARAAGFSTFYFIRRFKRETGMTPGEFLLRYRIVRAMDLLTGTAHSVAAVGRAVGYRDASAFSRAFQKVAGSSPRAYRRAQRSAPCPCATEALDQQVRAAEGREPYHPQPPTTT